MRCCATALVLLIVGLPCAAVPLAVQVGPSADAVVRSLEPDLNYGKGGALAASGSAALNGQEPPQQMGLLDSFMRFDMADLVSQMDAQFGASGWAIQTATLRLNEQARPNNPIYNRGQGQFEIRWIADDGWDEGTGTPKKPTSDGITFSTESLFLDPLADASLGDFDSFGPEVPEDFTDVFCLLDLAAPFVADVLAGGDVSLFLTAADDQVGFQCAAKDNKTPPSRPYLEIVADAAGPDVIPEPATASLLALGLLAGMRGIRRRRG